MGAGTAYLPRTQYEHSTLQASHQPLTTAVQRHCRSVATCVILAKDLDGNSYSYSTPLS